MLLDPKSLPKPAQTDVKVVAHEQRLRDEFPFPTQQDFFDLHIKDICATKVISSKLGKLAYTPVPKNACTTLKIFFFELNTGQRFQEESNRIHLKFDRMAVDFERFSADKEHFKFLVIRDPIERFISAFNNRVLFYKELSEHWIAHHARQELKVFDKLKLKFNPDFEEFVARFNDYLAASGRIHHHFSLQHLFFNSKPNAYDKVYTTRQLASLQEDLSHRIGSSVAFRNAQETEHLSRKVGLGDLSAKLLSKIIRYYLPDYNLLKPYLD